MRDRPVTHFARCYSLGFWAKFQIQYKMSTTDTYHEGRSHEFYCQFKFSAQGQVYKLLALACLYKLSWAESSMIVRSQEDKWYLLIILMFLTWKGRQNLSFPPTSCTKLTVFQPGSIVILIEPHCSGHVSPIPGLTCLLIDRSNVVQASCSHTNLLCETLLYYIVALITRIHCLWEAV